MGDCTGILCSLSALNWLLWLLWLLRPATYLCNIRGVQVFLLPQLVDTPAIGSAGVVQVLG